MQSECNSLDVVGVVVFIASYGQARSREPDSVNYGTGHQVRPDSGCQCPSSTSLSSSPILRDHF